MTTVCIEIPASSPKRWDCMVAIVDNLDGDVTLAFVDQNMTGEQNTMQLESKDAETPSAKWLRGPEKFTAQCKDGTLTCNIKIPFHRNF